MSAPRVRLGDLSVGFVQALADALLAAGVEPAPLLEQYGLDQRRLAEPGARLSIPRYMRLGHAAIQLSGDPALGLQMGRLSRLGQMGLAGVSVAQAPNLRAAARAMIHLEPLYAQNYRGQSSLVEDAGGAWLRFYSISPYNAYNRFVVDSVLAGWISHLGALARQPLKAERVEIEYPAPPWAERYEAFFGCPVEFGAPTNQLRLSQASLALANAEHCPSTWNQMLELCNRELEQLTRTRSWRERVSRLLQALERADARRIPPRPATERLITSRWRRPPALADRIRRHAAPAVLPGSRPSRITFRSSVSFSCRRGR